MKKIIGVDIGGTHIIASQVSMETMSLISDTLFREHLDSGNSAENIISVWSKVIDLSIGDVDKKNVKIGIAMPGPFDYENGISQIQNQGKYDALYGLNVKNLLSESLEIPTENIILNNDAACFLQGEIAKGGFVYHKAIGITLGTGLGSAYLENKTAVDADLWNMPFKDGIIEEYISSRWFVAACKAKNGIEISGVKELVDKFPNESFTNDLFKEFAEHLAFFLEKLIELQSPDCIIIGGNIAKAFSFFMVDLEKNLFDRLGYKLPIFLSQLGEDAAIIGAASMFYDNN